MYWDNILRERRNKKSSKQLFALTNLSLQKIPPKIFGHQDITRRYFLGKNYPEIYLTHREAQCMALLLEGKTIKGVGKVLHLSPRTVEFYVKNIRIKVKCHSKSQLIYKILRSDFMQCFDLY